MGRTLRIIAAIVAALCAAMVGGTASAAAASTTTYRSSAHVIRVPMELDCAHMSKKALSYAVEHDYCTVSKSGSITPSTTVTGDCGSSFITVKNLFALEAGVTYGFSSSQGAVVYRNLAVGWASDNGLNGGWSDTGVMFSTSYSASRSVNVGYGYVTFILGGSVTLWWGGSCAILNPKASANIT